MCVTSDLQHYCFWHDVGPEYNSLSITQSRDNAVTTWVGRDSFRKIDPTDIIISILVVIKRKRREKEKKKKNENGDIYLAPHSFKRCRRRLRRFWYVSSFRMQDKNLKSKFLRIVHSVLSRSLRIFITSYRFRKFYLYAVYSVHFSLIKLEFIVLIASMVLDPRISASYTANFSLTLESTWEKICTIK